MPHQICLFLGSCSKGIRYCCISIHTHLYEPKKKKKKKKREREKGKDLPPKTGLPDLANKNIDCPVKFKFR